MDSVMITAVATDPALIASTALANHRVRPASGERSLLPQGTPPAPQSSSASDNGAFPRQERPAEPAKPSEPERYGAASMFAASVIAGKIPPAPTTIEELVMRIGSIPLPPESEARLKDLIA